MPVSASDLFFDVLIQIFKHVSVIDPIKGPMTVSQVSRHWRGAALNFPPMWSTAIIRLNTTGSCSRHTLPSVYFKRSQKAPISLTVDATRHFRHEEMTKLLRPHTRRLRSLQLKTNSESLVNVLWSQLNMRCGQMPLLEVFSTYIENASGINVEGKFDHTTASGIVNNTIIIPPVTSDRNPINWTLWNPTGLTSLTLDATRLWEKPNLDDIYHLLATTCHTIQYFEYQGYISTINNPENTLTHLVFPALRSLTVFCHEDMVPLLSIMTIPALDSLILRDFDVCPATSDPPGTQMNADQFVLASDPEGLYRAIKRWTSVTNLQIFGVDDPSDPPPRRADSPPLPILLNFLESLDKLTSLVLYGIGIATSIADALFKYAEREKLLPKLSRFLLAINDMSLDLGKYLRARQDYELPHLEKLSINKEYHNHLRGLDSMAILWNSCDNIFIVADPELRNFIPIEEEKLLS